MKKMITWGLWACLYVSCVFLGFVSEPTGFGKVLCVAMALLFFVPGGLLLYWGRTENDPKSVRMIRWISVGSLLLTLLLLVMNFASAGMGTAAGNALYVLLVLVSVPMTASQYWVLSLFLWACLLMATFQKKRQR